MKHVKNRITAIAAACLLLCLLPRFASGQETCHTAAASAAVYDNGWQPGDAAGPGFGSWQLATSGSASYGLGSSATNGNGDDNGDGDINTGGRSWRLSAANGGGVNATLSVTPGLGTGSRLRALLDHGTMSGSSTVGYSLRNAQGQEVLRIFYEGANFRYLVQDAQGNRQTGLTYSDEGLEIRLLVQAGGGYSLELVQLVGRTANISGQLKNVATGLRMVEQLQLYAYHGGQAVPAVSFFNGIEVCRPIVCQVASVTAGTQTACNAQTNTYSQSLLLTYTSAAPAGGQLEINGQSYAMTAGALSQTITLTGLPSNGQGVSVSVSVAGENPLCAQTYNNLFTAPGDCVAPQISCPPGVTVSSSQDSCGAVVSYALPTATDNVAGVMLSRTGGPASGSFFALGATTVSWRATDAAGNTADCSFVVTVSEVAPRALCRDVSVYLDNNGEAAIAVADIDAGSADNCGIASRVLSNTSFDCDSTGARTVRLTVTDSAGLTAVCTATVTVADTTAPVLVCRSSTLVLTTGSTVVLQESDVVDQLNTTDNCGISSISIPSLSFNIGNAGLIVPIQVSAVDVSGNSSSCIGSVQLVSGDDPYQGWSVNNPSGYTYTANLTAQLVIDGAVDNDTSKVVALLSGSEVRAVNTPVRIGTQVFHFFTIYSNVAGGERLQIKLYDPSTEAVLTSVDSFTFRQQTVTGSLDAPYELSFSSDGDLLISMEAIPAQRRLQGMDFRPVALRDYLNQRDSDPIAWEVSDNPYFATVVSNDTLYISPVSTSWTGSTSLAIQATEQTLNAYTAASSLSLEILPGYAGPSFETVPPQYAAPGEAFDTISLADYETTYTGSCLNYSLSPQLPAAMVPPLPLPAWSVNGAAYSHTMSVTLQARYTPDYLFNHADDRVAAFIGGQLRGVAAAQVLGGRRLFLLQVYDNQVQGARVELRLYSGALGREFVLAEPLTFSSGGQVGTPDSPLSADFAPVLVSLAADGQLRVSLRDTSWQGSLSVMARAADCDFGEELQADTQIDYCRGVDSDGDGYCDFLDPDPLDACVPDRLNSACDFDGDGVYADVDPDDEDPCVPGILVASQAVQHPGCAGSTDGSFTLQLSSAYCSGGSFDVRMVEAATGATRLLGSNVTLPASIAVANVGVGSYGIELSIASAGGCNVATSCYPALTPGVAVLISQDVTPPVLVVRDGSQQLQQQLQQAYSADAVDCAANRSWTVEVQDNCSLPGYRPTLAAVLTAVGTSPAPALSVTGPDAGQRYSLSMRLPVGSHRLELTGTDTDGNETVITYTFDITDNTAPVAVCRDTTVALGTDGTFSLTAALLDGGSTDNCGITSRAVEGGSLLSCAQAGEEVVRSLRVTDAAGNSSSCEAVITVNGGSGLPAGWQAVSVGGTTGSVDWGACSEELVIRAAGTLGGGNDAYYGVQRQLCGDGELRARIVGLTGSGWGGIQLRETNAVLSKKVVLKNNMLPFIRREVRSQTGGQLQSQQLFLPNQSWLRLVRSGNDFIGYSSADGQSWQSIFFFAIPMGQCIELGLFAESTGSEQVVVRFTDVQVIGLSEGNDDNPAYLQTEGTGSKPAADRPAGLQTAALQPAYDESLAREAAEAQSPMISIYPNPAREVVHISGGEGLEVSWHNLLGQVVRRDLLRGGQSLLDVSAMPRGVYWLRLRQQGKEVACRRLLLAH